MRFACKNPALAVAVFAFVQLAPPLPAQAATPSRIVAVNVTSVVHPVTVEVLSHAIEQARREKADLVLIRLNTPGGLVDATRRMVEQIDASPVPVVTFVTPSGARAASAGFFLLEAGDVAAMTFGSNTGAASPVLMGAEMDPVMRRKVESDAAAWLRSQTTRRGRNTALAEKAVSEAKSFSDQEALDSNLIDVTVRDEAELIQKLRGWTVKRFNGATQTLQLDASPTVIEYNLTWRERIMTTLSDPNLAFLILIAGGFCLYFEFSAPGMVAPGVIGAILALLGLSAMSVLPINWMAAGLLVVGLACIVLEAKFASHGVLGAAGIAALVLGTLFLVDGPPEMRIRLSTALGVAMPFGVITCILAVLVVRSRKSKTQTGLPGMIAKEGVSITELNPLGKILVHGEYWNAVSTVHAAAGVPVRVIESNGMQLKVEPLSPSSSPSSSKDRKEQFSWNS